MSLSRVNAFLDLHPEFTLEGVTQPGHGTTNKVYFVRWGENLAVIKVFCERERKDRECFGLTHWQSTGLFPKLIYADDPTMIVMSHIPGMYLSQSRQLEGEQHWRAACRAAGHAIASLTRVPLPVADVTRFESRFYGAQTLRSFLERVLELGRLIHSRDSDFSGDFWRNSLDFMESSLETLLAQQRILYHQDMQYNVSGGKFRGFFDVEMCRVGTAAIQLGSSLSAIRVEDGSWEFFKQGWETAAGVLTQTDLEGAAAFNHVMTWRVISRYFSYDGRPGTGFDWASPADPVWARQTIERIDKMLGV